MNNLVNGVAVAMAAVVLSVSMALPIQASEEGKRNTTIGLGAASAALLLTQKNKLPGIVAGAGAIYSYTTYQKDISRRHARERAARARAARYHRSVRARHHAHHASK